MPHQTENQQYISCAREYFIAKGRYDELVTATKAKDRTFFTRELIESVDRTWNDGKRDGFIVVPDICGHLVRQTVAENVRWWKMYRREIEREDKRLEGWEKSSGSESDDLKGEKEVYKLWHPILLWHSYTLLFHPEHHPLANGLPITLSYKPDSYLRMTHHSLSSIYNQHRSAWLSSTSHSRLLAILETLKTSQDFMPIRKIVAFGLGTLQSPSPRALASSHVQTAALDTIRSVLDSDHHHTSSSPPSSSSLPVLSQDPAYNPLDTSFLQDHLHITIISDPKGFLEVDQHTLVYACAPDVPVRQILADMRESWPAAMFWNAVGKAKEDVDGSGGAGERRELTTDPESEKVVEMVKGCEEFEFEDQVWFGDMRFYARRKVSL